jgi:hypothetical protein
VCYEVKPVGKPDAVAPHVRFDERGWETELMSHRAHPRLYWVSSDREKHRYFAIIDNFDGCCFVTNVD